MVRSLERYDDEAGWMALPGVLDAASIDAILLECDRLAELDPADRRPDDAPHGGTRHLRGLDDRIPAVAEVTRHPRLVSIVEQIVGEHARLDQAGLRSPQPGFGEQRLHTDDVPLAAGEPARVATAIVALCDLDAGNGPTRVVPGSHRRPDLQRNPAALDPHPDEIRLTGPAGTAFVFSGHLLHSGTRNDGDAPRPALQLVWRTTRPLG